MTRILLDMASADEDHVGIMPRFLLLLAVLSAAAPAWADPPSLDEALRNAYATGKPVTSISPVFSELVRFAVPQGFQPAFENTKGDFYILELVPKGETVQAWTQMITMTGHRNLAGNPALTPQGMAGNIAAAFKNACPGSFGAQALGAARTDGTQPRDAYAGLAACGTVRGQGPDHSEAAMILAIRGSQDYYTLQWAERGPPAAQPAGLGDAKWQERLTLLRPIALCPRVDGEKAPYPSCTAK